MKIPVPAVLCLALLVPGVSRAASPEALDVEGSPLLRTWKPPVYPAEVLAQKVEGNVRVRFIVDAQGAVSSARVLTSADPRLDATALATVKGWTFSPGMAGGKPAAGCMDVTVEFSLAEARRKAKAGLQPRFDLLPQPAPHVEPEPKQTPSGDYPEILTERKIAGAVSFACVVSPEGRVLDPRITGATHADFVLPALDALKRWEFTPAMQGDLPVKAELEAKVSFDALGDSREEILAANGLTAPDGGVPALLVDPEVVVDPVWPLDLLLKGEGGSAVVEFTVRANGLTTGVKVREATRPEFGRALVAALEAWVFNPALDGGRAVAVPMLKRTVFKPELVGKESAADPVARVVAGLRAGTIGLATKLDERLTPLYRVSPVYPAELAAGARPAGRAEIEFVIDREGRARLPRILSATQEEFGWAAATAVAQWVFKAPRRDGQPVDVKVKIPFEFAAPAPR